MIVIALGAIFLGYGVTNISAQQLGTDQPCSSSYPCHKICGNHICAPGEVPGAPQGANQTRTQSTTQQTNQTMAQNQTTMTPVMPQELKFSSKGQISNSSGIAPGTVVWTILNGNNATFIYHAVNGLAVIRLTTSPDPVCDNTQAEICLDGKITQLKEPDQVLSVGGESKIKIHPAQNQETVGFLSGALQNIVLEIDLTKIWTYHAKPNANSTMLANPASTYCVNHGGTLQIKTGPAGQYGVCILPNGLQCEEWQYYRGECNPTQITNSTSANSTNSPSMHGTISQNSTSSSSVQIANSTYG